MKKILSILICCILISTMVACGNNEIDISQTDTSDISRSQSTAESNTETSKSDKAEDLDKIATDLFIKATEKIIALATNEPLSIIQDICDNINIDYKSKTEINKLSYFKTDGSFEDIEKYYSDLFCNSALEWISTSSAFKELDGVLYVREIGGATGWGIENVSVKKTEENIINEENKYTEYTYQATFSKTFYSDSVSTSEVETSIFKICDEDGDGEYKISDIDYKIPNFIK